VGHARHGQLLDEAGDEAIVTQNVGDFRGGELRLPQLENLTAAQFAMRLR